MRIVNQLLGGLFFCICLTFFVAEPSSLQAAPVTDTPGVIPVLTVSTIGSGTVAAQPQTPPYAYGQLVTLTATVAPGHEFAGWSGDLASPDDWWQPLWDYRVAINVNANNYQRTDKPVEVAINFTSLLNGLGQSTPFDPNSLRVVEVNAAAQVVDSNVIFQFDQAATYNATNNAAGTLVFLMSGSTAANQGRTYHLYFDVVGKGFSLPVFADQVVLTDNVTDQGQSSFQIATNNATYYYHKLGAGFSSLVDANNQDWLNYRRNVSGAGGRFRGIPNMIFPEGAFHPGNTDSTSTVLRSGPLKETIRSITNDGKWEATWEIFPTYARMTLLKKDHNYWFLYEGTPGGTFDPANDFVVRSDGTQNAVSQSWQVDLVGEEWAYFYDNRRTRALFVINHADDSAVDSYKPLTEASGSMTVFGFGRKNMPTPLESTLNAVPAQFTIGLMEQTAFASAAEVIRGAYKELAMAILLPQKRGQHIETVTSGSAVITLTMTSNRALVATFMPLTYTLERQSVGNGTVNPLPDQAGYQHGDLVTLTAVPAVGWAFAQWADDLSGTTNPATLTMDGDKRVTATFTQIPYTLAITQIGAGTVTKSPQQPTYVYGDVVTLNATADRGWFFAGWAGDLSGTTTPAALPLTGNGVVTATFAQETYTLAAAVSGNGTVGYTPQQATYVYGTVVTISATPAAGWQFVGWQGATTDTANPLVLTMDGNKAVTARFTQQSYALALTTQGAGTLAAAPQAATYPHGTTVTLTATPAAGWRFLRWSGDLSGATNPATVVMNEAKAIQAVFELISYTLTVEQPVGGSITWLPVKASYAPGDAITFQAQPAANYVFTGWRGALTGDRNPKVLTMSANATVSAKFTQTPYQITTNVVGSGTVAVTPSQANYQLNDQVVLTALPQAGWRFVGWRGDLSGSQSPVALTISSDVNATAQFAKDAYVISLAQQDALGTVTVTPQKSSYTYGEKVTLVALPNVGYRFVRWLLNPDGSRAVAENPLTLTIEDDLVIRADYAVSNAPINYLFLPLVAGD